MRRLSDGSAMSEARRFKTLMLGRSVGGGASAGALPQATVQNQMLIASATPDWTLLAAPTAEGQVPITSADPYTPAWGTTFPTVIQFDAGLTFGGATGVNVITVPDDAAQAAHIIDAGGIEYLRIVSTDAQPVARINPGTIDMDFQVRASGVAYALFVRGSDHYVSMNVADPLAPFHVHGRVLLNTGLAFSGTVPTPYIETPDNAAIALRLIDAGSIEYLRIISTDAQPVVVFNEGGADVDHRWEASGQENALFIQGSNGFIALGHDEPERIFHIKADGASIANIILEEYQSTAAGPDVFQRKGRGTIASPLDVAVDDDLGAWFFSGYRNSDWRRAAVVKGEVGALGASVVRGRIVFQTANASGTLVDNLIIDEDGNVHIIENSATVRLSGTFAFVFVIPEPIVETVGQIRIAWACTVTRVDANVVGGTSCTFNIEERGTLGSAGTDVLSSDMVADANGESVTSAFGNSSLAEGNHLAYDVSAVSGAVTEVSITLTGTID